MKGTYAVVLPDKCSPAFTALLVALGWTQGIMSVCLPTENFKYFGRTEMTATITKRVFSFLSRVLI